MNSSTSADLPIRRRPRTMTHLPGRAEPASPRTSASIPSSRASSRRRPTKPAIAAPKTIPIDTSSRDTILIGSIHQSSVAASEVPRYTDTSGKGSSGGAVSVCGSVESLERDQAVHPDAGMSPSRPAVTSTPRPATRVRGSAVSVLPRIHGHHPAAGDPDDRPVPARQVIHADPGIPRPRLNSGQTPRSRGYRTTLTALTRHFTLPAPHPQSTSPPRHTDPCATRNRAAAKIPTKSPQLTGPISHTRNIDP